MAFAAVSKGARASQQTPPVLSPTEFCMVVCSFPLVRYFCPLSAGVLHALLSECVFLMYPWRERYSTSTYSSTILFSSP